MHIVGVKIHEHTNPAKTQHFDYQKKRRLYVENSELNNINKNHLYLRLSDVLFFENMFFLFP